jgi:hypothetical protein
VRSRNGCDKISPANKSDGEQPKPTGAANMVEEPQVSSVRVIDIKMSFWSMVVFLVKLAIAAIPAAIILTIIGVIFWSVIGAMFFHK